MQPDFYPLTAAQRSYETALQQFWQPQILNIGVCLALQMKLEEEILRTCIQTEYQMFECLRIRFAKQNTQKSLCQYLSPDNTPVIKTADLSGMTEEAAGKTMEQWTRLPLCRFDSPMCEFTIVKLPGGYQGIYLKIDHMIIDSCGIIGMANDIISLYCHLLFHAPAPKPPASYIKALKKDLEYESNETKKARDEAFWNQLFDMGEPVYTDITGTRKLAESRKKHHLPDLRAADCEQEDISEEQKCFYLDAKTSRLLSQFCMDKKTTMSNLLLMAIRTCLSGINGCGEDISIRNYISRRSLRRNRTCGGSRVHYYPCRTVMEPGITFYDGIQKLQALQHDIYRHVNCDPALVEQLLAKKYQAPANTTYEGIALTYQPLPITFQNSLLDHIPFKTQWLSNGATIQKAYLTVMPAKTGLEFRFKYQKKELTEPDIKRFYQSLIHVLQTGVKQPGITVKQLLSLSF